MGFTAATGAVATSPAPLWEKREKDEADEEEESYLWGLREPGTIFFSAFSRHGLIWTYK